MESLLSVVLVIFIILIVLVIFIPAYLDRLSQRNRAQRDERTAELRAMERDAGRMERLLIPYGRTRSAAYQAGAAATGATLATLKGKLTAAGETLSGMRCPQVFGYLLPAQHFVVSPEHAGVILADARRLRRARAELADAGATAAQAQAGLDALAALPEQLAAERTTLTRQLVEVEGAIRRERAAGIEALDDLTRAVAEAKKSLGEWEGASAAGATLMALDGGAVALESAAATLGEAEARAGDLAGERTALDERLRRATGELDEMQVATKSGTSVAGPPQVSSLMRRAAQLLNESAPDHRPRREFAAAGADVDAAARLIATGRDVTAADQTMKLLEEREDGVSLSADITGLRRELTELLGRLGGSAVGSEAGGAGMTEAALAARAAQLRARGEALARRQEEVIANLEREAAATRDQLERAWEVSAQLLPLAADDPLTRRHARLLTDFEAAQRRPAALEQFRRDVAAFEGVLGPWVTRLQVARQRVVRLRERLPVLIDAALAAAGPWNCLAEPVAAIQQLAADFETTQARFAAANHRREAEALMDQLESIETNVGERFAQADDRAERLRFLEADVGQILDLSAEDVEHFPADHPERIRWDKAMKVIDHHIRSAHAAKSYEDASVALLRAADVANKLAL